MSPTLTTFLFEAANFLVLAAVLGRFFFKPVRQALADRRAKFEAEAQQAAQKLAEAQKTQQQIDTAHANLQAELNELRTRELDAAREQADQLLADAHAAAERQREMSRRQAARISETQRDTLAQAATAAAAQAVGRLLDQIAGPDLQSALIRSACQQLRSLPQEGITPVKIESSQPLSPEQRAELTNALGPAGSGADFRTVAGLSAGVRISTGKGLIDASVDGLTHFARQSLVKEMNRLAINHNPLQGVNDA